MFAQTLGKQHIFQLENIRDEVLLLLEEHVENPIETANGLLFNNETLQFNDENSADKEDEINNTVEELRKKIPVVLFITAPIEPPGSMKRTNEQRQRNEEGKNFLKAAFGEEFHKYIQYEFQEALCYADMEVAVKNFIKKRASGKHKPFVFFLGHGEEGTGKLCFEKERIDIITVKQGVNDIFHKHKDDDVPEGGMEFVFCECYAHLIDSGTGAGQVQQANPGEIEYMYLTSKQKPETTSLQTILKGDTTSLSEIKHEVDIHLKLWSEHPFMVKAVSALRKHMKAVYSDSNDDKDIVALINTGELCISGYRKNKEKFLILKKKVTEVRKKMKSQLIIYTTKRDKDAEKMINHWIDPTFDYERRKAMNKEELQSTIDGFLKDGRQTAMPVITIFGDIVNWKLFDSEIEKIFENAKQKTKDRELRMIFLSKKQKEADEVDAELQSEPFFIASNASLPVLVTSKIVELEENKDAIFGDCEVNKNIETTPPVPMKH